MLLTDIIFLSWEMLRFRKLHLDRTKAKPKVIEDIPYANRAVPEVHSHPWTKPQRYKQTQGGIPSKPKNIHRKEFHTRKKERKSATRTGNKQPKSLIPLS